MLIVDGHGTHISIESIEFCSAVKIMGYCVPLHSLHLLQQVDVGLLPPLQEAYRKQTDRFVRFGNVGINKGNFLHTLVAPCKATYLPKNITSA